MNFLKYLIFIHADNNSLRFMDGLNFGNWRVVILVSGTNKTPVNATTPPMKKIVCNFKKLLYDHPM